jgi:hypothetical protein
MGGGGEYKDSRVEQDIKAEVATSVDDHLDCEELVFPPATTVDACGAGIAWGFVRSVSRLYALSPTKK